MGDDTILIGTGITNTGQNVGAGTIVIGNNGGSTGVNTIGSGSILIGNGQGANSVGSMTNAILIGHGASGRPFSDSGVAIGNNALAWASSTAIQGNASASNSVAINAFTNGDGSVVIGNGASSRFHSVNIGFQSSIFGGSFSQNVAIGTFTMGSATGSNSVAVGYAALGGQSVGANNTGIGFNAGGTNATGSHNVFLGNQANPVANNRSFQTVLGDSAVGDTDCVVIGRLATATAANQFVVGSSAHPAGAVVTEVLAANRSWAVRINGVAYKILMNA